MNFKEAEARYAKLKKDYDEGLITLDEFKAQVKNLIVKDEYGNIWSIGLRTGKWYKKVGDQWKQEEPSYKTQTLDLEKLIPREEEDRVICPKCGKEVPSYFVFCPYCGARIRDEEGEAMEREYIMRRIAPFSMALVMGGLGILIGVILGAFAEALAPSLLTRLGLSFPTLGTLWKSFLYSIMTGFFSFFLFFLVGFVMALIINLILSVFGGLKFYLT